MSILIFFINYKKLKLPRNQILYSYKLTRLIYAIYFYHLENYYVVYIKLFLQILSQELIFLNN